MRFGLNVGYSGARIAIDMGLIKEADRLGFHSVWSAEAYGSDAVTPLAWIAGQTERIHVASGIMQMPARTPAMTAMTASTLDQLSGGRFLLGLGVSGPQVVEGWYGQAFPRPMERTREFVALVRQMLRREGPVTFQGNQYTLPLQGGARLGKPLKLINAPLRTHVPIYIGAEGPKNIKMVTEIADGWLPLYYSPYRPEVYAESLTELRPGFEIAPPVTVSVNDDLETALQPVKYMLAFYIGGMGAKSRNFHLNLVKRFGFEREADEVQRLFLEGKRAEAAAAVPDRFADEISLCGSPARIKDRAQAWKGSPVTTMLVGSRDAAAVRVLADALL
jgi:F420-dependent oxidoreductase-like protein